MDAETFAFEPAIEIAGEDPAGELDFVAGCRKRPRQARAAHNVAAADRGRCIGSEQAAHRRASQGRLSIGPAATRAAYINSARAQSSGVSISWTRWRGSRIGIECAANIGSPERNAAVRPQ